MVYQNPPLPEDAEYAGDPSNLRRPMNVVILLPSGLLAVGLVVILIGGGLVPVDGVALVSSSFDSMSPERLTTSSQCGGDTSEGASENSFRPLSGKYSYPWTNKRLTWQRTAFHFQPKKNWMNDPNGPLFYKGWYHLFYQYNPNGALWGNIVWGHAASTDLINWCHLPIAMTADHWYDINGVWTGSATILPDDQIVMIYTGITNESMQVQNLAYPADLSDPLLTNWVKYSGNPVLVPPPGILFDEFRDPSTAWHTSDDKWRITVGSKLDKMGISLVYDTSDFKSYELLDGLLHAVPGTGMWECVDFYPVSKIEENGLDTSANGPGVKHVVKASIFNEMNDYYALGSYDAGKGKWIPDDSKVDVGIGLRYDYGTFYASKTFYDQNKSRRVLLSWIKETDSESVDVKKGWASLQGIPRTILFDKKTGSNIIQWPVKEVESLRLNNNEFEDVEIEAGSVVPLHVGLADQLDITAEFEINKDDLKRVSGGNVVYNCSAGGGAAERGALGPFGLLVLADKNLTEQTPVYFYIVKGTDGNLSSFFCQDQSRSSEATDVDKAIYGSIVPVLKGEKLSVRILVDHSIVESFAQGGRTCITSRVYPTKAIYGDAKLFLFNNATQAKITASLNIWQMKSAVIQSYIYPPQADN